VRTLSSLLRRKVVTEGGRNLGRCYDVRAEMTQSSLKVTGLCVGRSGWAEHFGLRRGARTRGHDPVPWDAVVRIEGDRIVVHDIQ
jgi:sporulation protein YlmC with PRC-barrel domain